MDPENTVCGLCIQRLAELFCVCTDPETLLCRNCFIDHLTKSPELEHKTRPLDQLRYLKIPQYYERLKCRRENFPMVREAALKGIEKVDEAIRDYSAKVEWTIRELTAYSKVVVEQLSQMKAELVRETNAAIEEVERTLAQDPVPFNTKYGPVLRDLTEVFRPFQIFSFAAKAINPESILPVDFRLCDPREMLQPGFAAIYLSSLFLYNPSISSTTKHPLSINFSIGGSYIELDKNSIMCTGGDPATSAVNSLDLSSFKFTPLPALTTARKGLGVGRAKAVFYVFGGRDGSAHDLIECEKWEIGGMNWTTAGSMNHPKAYFTPCNYNSVIFLASSWDASSRIVEKFDPEAETFTDLSVSLFTETISYTTSFIAYGELFLLTDKKQLACWKIDSEATFRVMTTNGACDSSRQPRIIGSQVLLANKGTVVKFSLETYSYVD